MIRKLKFNGLWYPDDKEELEKLVKITPNGENNLFGVVPHAGLYYSSSLIKLFFNSLDSKVNKIILLSPSHYYPLEDNQIVSGNFEYYESKFTNIKGFSLSIFSQGYEKVTVEEHAIEMILPFIAQIKNISLCTAHVNKFNNMDIASEYAHKILSAIDEKTAVIASSDFTHYGYRFNYTPYGKIINEDLFNKVSLHDREVANQFIRGNTIETYLKLNNIEKATICGLAPILIVSEMARINKMKGKILAQSNSITPPFYEKSFVSYLSLAWRK